MTSFSNCGKNQLPSCFSVLHIKVATASSGIDKLCKIKLIKCNSIGLGVQIRVTMTRSTSGMDVQIRVNMMVGG